MFGFESNFQLCCHHDFVISSIYYSMIIYIYSKPVLWHGNFVLFYWLQKVDQGKFYINKKKLT